MCSYYTTLLWYKLKSNKLTDHELNPPNLEPRQIFSFSKVFGYFMVITQSGQSASGPEYRQPYTLTSLLLCPSGWRFIDVFSVTLLGSDKLKLIGLSSAFYSNALKERDRMQ